MVYPVMAGRVEDVLQGSQMVHQLCVEPELKIPHAPISFEEFV
jgi:hypothetical protein